MRREKVLTDVNIRATRTTWERTRYLLESITPHEFEHAIRLQQHHQPIQNPAINQLLKLLGQIGMASPGSDDKKSYMLTELKSSVVFYGMPVIYLTINPGDRNSPLPLLYSGVKINVKNFIPEDYRYTDRVTWLLKNPLAVVEYFHNMVNALIEAVLKKGFFGKMIHHYGTIEYQGRFTPHMHMAVSYSTKYC